jgi:molybdopterin-guanine dinucleotide biosynthesis protein A
VLAGEKLIDRTIQTLRSRFEEIIVSSNTEFSRPGVITLGDEIGEGPLAGIYQGLVHCKSEYLYVIACDMPFVSGDYISFLKTAAQAAQAAAQAAPRAALADDTAQAAQADAAAQAALADATAQAAPRAAWADDTAQAALADAQTGAYDAVLARRADGFLEPFNAFYRKSCAPVMRDALQNNIYKVLYVLEKLKLLVISPNETERFASGKMFYNINYEADLAAIRNSTGMGFVGQAAVLSKNSCPASP